MYAVVLAIHNIIRWIVLVMSFGVAGISLLGWFGKREWGQTERKFGIIFTSSMDLQLLLGIILYLFISEWGLRAIMDKGMAFVMGTGEYRFFALEHTFYMLLSVIFAHLGSILPRKVDDSHRKFMRASICYGMATLLILVGMPWFRPLLPGLSSI